MLSDSSKWRKNQLGEIGKPIFALKGQLKLLLHLILVLHFLFWVATTGLGANQAHLTGFQFVCMQIIELDSTRNILEI